MVRFLVLYHQPQDVAAFESHLIKGLPDALGQELTNEPDGY
jgi:hypothetical protein